MDPNNLGYILSSLLLYFMFHFQFEKKFFFLLLVIPITSFSLILTQSSGTFISLFITLLVYFFYWLFNNKFIFSKLLTKFIFLFFILFVIVGSINYFLPLIEYFQDFDIVAIALNRLNSNSLDSRIEIWFYAFNNTSIYYLLYLVFFGFGGITIINGLEYSIHSGPLLLIYAYGLLPFIFLSFTMLKYFIKNKFHNYFWLIPSLIGVIINIVFGEYKIILILLILINFQYYWGIYGSFNRKKT
jgi:hypothetical protein